MNKKYFLAFFTSLALFCGCKARNADAKMKEISDKEEKDFAYRTFFLPRASRTKSAYAGDCMPFSWKQAEQEVRIVGLEQVLS